MVKSKKTLSRDALSAALRSALSPLSLLMLTVAGIVNAFGVVLFLSPVALYDSGISGTSMLLAQLASRVPFSVFLIVLNVPLFLYGLRREGAVFTIRSIYTVVVYSLAAAFFGRFAKPGASPIAGSDLLLCAIFGGLISGIGSGTTIRYGGALDGIEVLAVIFSRRLGMTVGTFVMAYNAVLYIIAGAVMGSWILPLYSIVTYAIGIKAVDFIVEGLDKTKAAMIITDHPQDICRELSAAFGTGITLIDAHGYYSGDSKTLVYFVVNRFQIARMRTIVHDIDAQAFISITEVSDLFGKNAK
ncbi:MAG: YitT family protein [Candidatus Ventricola sp.]